MVDDIPYIIVDNQRIPPISRALKTGSATADGAKHQAPPFGVVDRVTISTEAMQKLRQHQASVEADFRVLPSSPAKSPAETIIRLTELPKKNV